MTALTPSSTAERSYWLGRYLERAETSARLVTVHAHLLIDLPRRTALGWRPLVAITGNTPLYDDLFEETSERNVCRFLINDQRNPGSRCQSSAPGAVEYTRTRDVRGGDLRFLDQCQRRLPQLHDQIHRTYFDSRPRHRPRPGPSKQQLGTNATQG